MKRLTTFIGLLSLAAGGVTAARAEDSNSNERAAQQLMAATVTVRTSALKPVRKEPSSPDNAAADEVVVSSGVCVKKGRVVTFIGDRDCRSARFRVTLPAGEQAAAELRVVDHYSGLVLLKIDADLPTLALADDLPGIGATLLTAAAAGVDRPAVSAGILGGVDRTLPSTDLPPLLQCDVRTTETSSGAGIVDRQSKLIGIVVASASPAGRTGWAYAAPVSHVIRLAAAEKDGEVVELKRRRPTVGFTLGPADKEGVVQVERVEPGPAATAGIQKGDLVLQADGRKIRSAYQAVSRILAKQPGDKITLVIDRAGQRKTIDVTLGASSAAADGVVSTDPTIVRVGPQLSVSSVGGAQITVRNGQTSDQVDTDGGARSRRGPISETEMLRIQIDGFEKVIRRLQSELDQRERSQVETDKLIKSLRDEISQLKKEPGQGTTQGR